MSGRPITHTLLGRVPPLTYLARVTTRSESSYAWSTSRGSLPNLKRSLPWRLKDLLTERGRGGAIHFGPTDERHRVWMDQDPDESDSRLGCCSFVLEPRFRRRCYRRLRCGRLPT